jgi:hypothetical protein
MLPTRAAAGRGQEAEKGAGDGVGAGLVPPADAVDGGITGRPASASSASLCPPPAAEPPIAGAVLQLPSVSLPMAALDGELDRPMLVRVTDTGSKGILRRDGYSCYVSFFYPINPKKKHHPYFFSFS